MWETPQAQVPVKRATRHFTFVQAYQDGPTYTLTGQGALYTWGPFIQDTLEPIRFTCNPPTQLYKAAKRHGLQTF